MLFASAVSAFIVVADGIGVVAHNQYENRHSLLDTGIQQPDHRSTFLGLTPKELTLCDEYTEKAYRQAVEDGYRLGTGYTSSMRRGLVLSALLFLTSVVGLRAASNAKRCGEKSSKQTLHATAAAPPVL